MERLRSLRRKELAMVFQHFGLLPHYTVLQNIAFGLELQGVEKRERELKAAESMRLVGLDGYADLMVSELSGGMQQRVGLARALANDPEVLLMDEPTSALDPISTSKVEELALELKDRYTIVIVTHNMQQAARISDKTAFFLLGELVEMGDTERLFSTPEDKRTEDYISGRFG